METPVTRPLLKLAAALMAVVMLLAACGGDETDTTTGDTATGDGPAVTTTAAAAADPADETGDTDATGGSPDAGSIDDAFAAIPLETRIGIAVDQLDNVDRFEVNGSDATIYYTEGDEMTHTMDCMIVSMSVLLDGETLTLHVPNMDPHICE